MALFDRVAELPLVIEALEFEQAVLAVSPEFIRTTTTVVLRGGRNAAGAALSGRGEDVTYSPDEHAPERLARPELSGEWTLATLSARLEREQLFPGDGPAMPAFRDYRRWAFESAALGRAPRPLRFVSSTRAGSLEGWLALYPELRFKLDATPAWTDDYAAQLAARGNVDVVDLKGAYHGTPVDNPPDAALYRRVVECFPDAWIEDPALSPETEPVLAPHLDRVTWDAPIHSFADVEALAHTPRCLNCKPSRFGTLERLFDFYDRCAEHGIALYGGGQFELGIGRSQIQLLASLFHPDGPNDVAPGGYNEQQPRAGLPTSPLELRPAAAGFRPADPN